MQTSSQGTAAVRICAASAATVSRISRLYMGMHIEIIAPITQKARIYCWNV